MQIVLSFFILLHFIAANQVASGKSLILNYFLKLFSNLIEKAYPPCAFDDAIQQALFG